MAVLRALLLVAGLILAFFGTFFALQGAGIIMWPAESFMLADRQWAINGAIVLAVGVILIVVGTRRRRG